MTALSPTFPLAARTKPRHLRREDADELLMPVFSTAAESESLLGSQHPMRVNGTDFEIPKFMLLGQRGGGKPIRIAFFAGLDAESMDTIAALSRLLLQLELNPALARDFALFAYPIVNLFGFEPSVEPLRKFEARYAADRRDGDVQFYKNELRKWFFDGMVMLRTDRTADGFYAVVRSDVIAREVVRPVIATAGKVLPLLDAPLRVRPSDQRARLGDYVQGRLAPPADIRPYPFEIELFAPGAAPVEDRVRGLFLAMHEILLSYRRIASHAQHI